MVGLLGRGRRRLIGLVVVSVGALIDTLPLMHALP
jgi:hypothetical protein